jgi:hypothetical protein
MNKFVKYTAAAALAGVFAIATAMPSQARHGHNAAAIGFGAGALVGAAAAGAAYNNGYYYGPGPGYYGDYAYEPGYGYDADPGYVYDSGPAYYYGAPGFRNHQQDCTVSPSSRMYNSCY